MTEIEFFVAGHSEGELLSDGLRTLTAAIEKATGEEGGWGLGGEHGYGAEFENDVFEMHRFNWEEDCTEGCPYHWEEWEAHVQHADACYQTELRLREEAAGLGYDSATWEPKTKLSYDERRRREDAIYTELCAKYGKDRERGAAVHCTCDFRERFDAFHAEHSTEHMPSCCIVRPNFRHKATGFTVRWYKWIGRDNEVDESSCEDGTAMLNECIQSLSTSNTSTPEEAG